MIPGYYLIALQRYESCGGAGKVVCGTAFIVALATVGRGGVTISETGTPIFNGNGFATGV